MEESEKDMEAISNVIDKDDKYKQLKKRYSTLLQQHIRVHLEYRQMNE
jgi:hypothetical protein